MDFENEQIYVFDAVKTNKSKLVIPVTNKT